MHCVCSDLKRRGDYVKRRVHLGSAWNTRGVFVGTLLEVSFPLMSFENFDSFFTQ